MKEIKRFIYSIIFIFTLLIFFTSCGKSAQPTLKVAASSVPHAEILEFIKGSLKEQNITLEVLIIDDFNIPNRALADKEVDANFFQHLPFLEAQMADFKYEFEPLIAVHLEPMAFYSKKISEIKDIKDKALIAIPSDPSNQARALALCEKMGLITIKAKGAKSSVLDVESNPYHLQLVEMDSPLLSRALEDVDAAIINTNFALLGGLSPKEDALAIEDRQSQYANYLVIRKGENQRKELQALKSALTTEKVRKFIDKKYQNAIISAF